MKNTLTSFYPKAKSYIVAHKIVSGVALVIILFGGYKTYAAATSTSGETKYVIAAVNKGTVISTVTGTGQVSASDQITISSKASGDVTSVNVVSGQTVSAGDLLVSLDATDAARSLQSAQISLAKLTEPADPATLTSAQNAVTSAQEAAANAETNLGTSYVNGLSTVAATFVDMPAVISGLHDMLYSSSGTLNDVDTTNLPPTAQQYREDAGANFDIANNQYNVNLTDYKALTSASATSSISAIINETYNTTVQLTQAVKDAKSTIDYVNNLGSVSTLKNITTAQSNLNAWLNELTGHLNDLTTIKANIQDAQNTITSSQGQVTQAQEALQKLQQGPDALDVQSAQLNIDSAQEAYDNYFVRAPFDGVVASLTVNPHDSISSGTSLGTLITQSKIASITLNEVDVAKVKVGDNVTLTFDAIDGLSIVGQVAEVDQVGTVSQGVVSYAVKIAFDTQDPRVKTDMSVSAAIDTDVEQNVTVVPNSAIKTSGSSSYVQVVDPSTPVSSAQGVVLTTAPQNQVVTIGTADDTNTEILSGLNVGDKIVTKTIVPTGAKTSTTATATSLLGGGGAARGGAGGARGGAAVGGAFGR